MKWVISLQGLTIWKWNSIGKRLDWLLLNNSCSNINLGCRNRWLIIAWNMILRKIRYCSRISIIGLMILRRNWYRMNLPFMLFNNILKLKARKVIIKLHSKIVWGYVMKLIWTLLRKVLVFSDLHLHTSIKLFFSNNLSLYQ
jgi:hypothetical protein